MTSLISAAPVFRKSLAGFNSLKTAENYADQSHKNFCQTNVRLAGNLRTTKQGKNYLRRNLNFLDDISYLQALINRRRRSRVKAPLALTTSRPSTSEGSGTTTNVAE